MWVCTILYVLEIICIHKHTIIVRFYSFLKHSWSIKNEHIFCNVTRDILVSSVDSAFLLFAKKQEIRGVDLNNAHYNVIPTLTLPFVHNPLALDYDLANQRLYWTDDGKVNGAHSINSIGLDGTNFETVIDAGRWIDIDLILVDTDARWPYILHKHPSTLCWITYLPVQIFCSQHVHVESHIIQLRCV